MRNDDDLEPATLVIPRVDGGGPADAVPDDAVRRTRAARRRARRRRGRVLGIVGAVIVLAAVVTVYVLVKHATAPRLTFQGRPIADAGAPLKQAERTVAEIVGKRHGAEDGDTRCYYTRPVGQPPGGDVGSSLFCGPVLFVDGDPAQPYLQFPLVGEPTAGQAVALSAAATPVAGDPAAVPTGLALLRPDGANPPMGSGSLTVPAPPPAAADVLTVVSGLADGLPKAPDGAVMAAQEGGVRLLRAGPVPRFGKGDDARTAPAGQTLLAFTYEDIAGQYGSAPMQVSLAVSGVPVRTVPSLAAGEAVVVAVPAKASADLVLKADGLTQTLAVPSGRPGAGNVAVLARSHRQAPLKVSQPLTVALGPGAPIQGSLTATEAVLGYWARAGQNHAASTDRAYLTVDLSFSAPNQAQALAIDAALLTLTPTGGSPMKAVDLDPSDQVYAAFEVPADFTGGVITVGGSETTPAGLTLAISQPVNVPIGFQAG